MGLALIASIGQIIPMCLIALIGSLASYLFSHRFLRPIVIFLFPIGILIMFALFVIFMPFWCLAMISGSYLYCQDAVSGSFEDGGIRLLCQRRLSRESLPWEEIRNIRWKLTPPLGAHFVVGLMDGSEVKIHSLPFESPKEACRQVEIRAGISRGEPETGNA
jgi:hypothetical protein